MTSSGLPRDAGPDGARVVAMLRTLAELTSDEAGAQQVAVGRLFCPPDGVRVEFPLDPRSGRGYRLQRPRVHDLLGRLPDGREVPRDR